jgi:hypothetical protein
MTKSKWFLNVKTIDELKKVYRKLAMQYHPDICKESYAEENMKEINNEYETMFNYIISHATETEQKQYNKQGHNVNDGYREIINKIIHIPDIIIELCGSWLWISGNTKPVKNLLKDAGFYWAAKKFQWYWRPAEYKQTYNKKSMTMDYIRSKYGSEQIHNKPFEQLESA